MNTRVTLLAAAASLVLGASAAIAAGPASIPPDGATSGLYVGAASIDQSWHIGAPAGQYADMVEPDQIIQQEWDPNLQHVTKQSSYALQTRMLVKAIVLRDGGGAPIALVKQDAYLSQDMLSRRVAQLLSADGSQVTYDHLMISATHDHSAPYYTTPAAGVWLFEDVMDLRQFEYQARAIAAAIEQAERTVQPARMSATQVQFPDFQGNIQGPAVADDGSPAGYPREENDHGLAVMRFDTRAGKPIATWINYAEHGEELDGYNILSADFLGALQSEVEKTTGSTLVFTQGSVGSAEGPYEGWYPAGQSPTLSDGTRKVFGHAGFAQMHRGAHLLAAQVIGAWRDLGSNKGLVPWSSNPVVSMLTRWTPGPLSHPYPGVSNCRTETTLQGNIGFPILGLPDCERGDIPELPLTPLYDQIKKLNLPIPANYDGTAFPLVEENLRLKLQAVRIGEVLLASCACEPQSDLIKNIETRTDKVQGNEWLGYDWSTQCSRKGAGWDCPNPTQALKNGRLTVSDGAYQRMVAEVRNDAAGWDDPSYVAQANSEPTDPKQIKGNFTHQENPASLGYTLTIGLGHTSDYNGYTVSYREFQAHDGYRKALTSYGPHTADYMATKLAAMAAFLRGGPALAAEPDAAINTADEQRASAEATLLGALSSEYYDLYPSTLPDDAVAAITTQPSSIRRFGASVLTWTGGDNYFDNPTVHVQRLVGGTWKPYADQLDGAVVTSYDTTGGLTNVVTRSSSHTWHAVFEAYDAWPKANLAGGQTPVGTYRFVVDGKRASGGAASSYHLTSKAFSVGAWDGLKVASVRRGSGGSVVVTPAKQAYPKTYKTSALPTVGDDGQRYICRTCSMMPWATVIHVQSVQVTVQRGGRTVRTVPAVAHGTSWVAATHLAVGETAVVLPGGVRDQYGETNLAAARLS